MEVLELLESKQSDPIGPDFWEEGKFRRMMRNGSLSLERAINVHKGLKWPCGHPRNAGTSFGFGGHVKCSVCIWDREQAEKAKREAEEAKSLARAQRLEELQVKLINLAARERQISDVRAKYRGALPFAELCESVAQEFNMERDELLSHRRNSEYTGARAVVIKILRDRGLSFPVIGRLMDGRDHTTVMAACRNFELYCLRDYRVLLAYEKLCDPVVQDA